MFNLILGGGGVKGIAYVGVFEAAERRGYEFLNIAGVSAGSLAGSIKAAGYKAVELGRILKDFNFGNIKMEEIKKKVPVVERYLNFVRVYGDYRGSNVEYFLSQNYLPGMNRYGGIYAGYRDYRGNILNNIITYSNEGCLFDGDYLEEWVYKVLAAKGIRVFGDVRTQSKDQLNPRGYKIRMTAFDATRAKVIVLPDDIAFYGSDPDKLEISKAVRMSTSVPFAFKPVQITSTQGNKYNLVDGGVFDNLPFWLVEERKKTLIFRMYGEKKLISIDTPLNALKFLISKVHDLGIPTKNDNIHLQNMAEIDASKVSFLDFDLSDKDKDYLIDEGRKAGNILFDRLEGISTKK
ncbi:MAG: patatin-like phospholipase family protein [Clostridia bacterium]|nr:patatin-like phospholipase family protein [Clostridia bacterium]